MTLFLKHQIIFYQLDLITPGISPRKAILRKHILQIPNFLKNALGLPQMGHLLYVRVENFCFLCALAIRDFFAKLTSVLIPERHS
jgi:hypothetical protein